MILDLISLAVFALLSAPPHEPAPDLAIGTTLPAAAVKMMDVSGTELTLKEAAGKNGLLVIFSCNTCPFVVGTDGSAGWEGRYPELAAFSKRMEVGMVLVNSNEANRDAGDGMADMQERFKSHKYGSRYVLDQNSKVADAFGARTTPHVFLFNKEMKLVYKGAIDDNVANPAEVKEKWLHDAITNLVTNKPIEPATTRNIGCSIKRVKHEH